jgi:tRNA A37 N6-isopentenylltransferase MiaA
MTTRARLVLTGPTGVGKTEYMNALMELLPVEVINMDSIQVYSFFRIGPGRSDARHGVRRHLYGYLSPHDTLDVASYVRNATAVADEIELYGQLPMFEGGSRSLLPALRAALPLKIFGIRPPDDLEWRRARLRQRVDGYFQDDLLVREIQEAQRLGYGDTRLMRDPLVYMQTRDYLAGKLTLEECKRAMVESMLQMQDAQLGVFNPLPDITWVTAGKDSPAELARQLKLWLEESGWRSALRGRSP